SQNTGRYLETAFENIDIFLEEMAQSDGMISLIRTKADGLGLDFTKYDGPRPLEDRPDRRPRETPSIKRFEEVEDLYNLVEVLQKRGFKEADIAKILGENYLRVLRDVL
ncbi:MAG: membrane dipeptidase, partial [Deltaproteobacteria bacterium]|nr:membrane dipeptidase [Deltaproteobacteria bacterium]